MTMASSSSAIAGFPSSPAAFSLFSHVHFRWLQEFSGSKFDSRVAGIERSEPQLPGFPGARFARPPATLTLQGGNLELLNLESNGGRPRFA